ncbi:hypothetical protein [Novosphingobium olei]|uniref:Uncharacterized protein n=1 Tax=Novosphingobium olei TaxID=2728851 RepID=A0A7Y0BT57_9SPHN|nr:hypothetical protein [Novosphingobium olei]NML95461.1 hypothetical protein [Novosphingobium olei]
MSFKRLETVDDLARYGFSLRVVCEGCDHVAVLDARELADRLHAKRASRRIGNLADRMRCSMCGSKQVTALPSQAEPGR